MIKAIAEELTRQSMGSGQQKNYYASLFGELHRRFRVSTYKNLTIEKYERAMAWLRDYDEALGRSLPPILARLSWHIHRPVGPDAAMRGSDNPLTIR